MQSVQNGRPDYIAESPSLSSVPLVFDAESFDVAKTNGFKNYYLCFFLNLAVNTRKRSFYPNLNIYLCHFVRLNRFGFFHNLFYT